ncbi:hypothetical protein CN378_18540 [Bacillus sp. AFS015802]|uniref:hypothetical protein n=1 Tax=Bacillus sp. AFS015802 TaxID=2033486 RepID=UPI000BF78B8F|nr:hypothetical protein [Bacillus sp. AFS015802]PFA63037.1 hypothetical protein CN378_18540 [Bacillus sp. AFS015802]
MDELKSLRGLMKEETFKGRGFTDQMRENIRSEVHSKKPGPFSVHKKPIFAPILSVLFFAACLSVFVYFGGTQLGIFGNNASAPLHEVSDRPEFLGKEFKFITKVPFEVKNVSTKTAEGPYGNMQMITLLGPEKQTITMSFHLLEPGTDLNLLQEPVKVGTSTGSYTESEGPLKSNLLTWIEGESLYELKYMPARSGISLTKDDMIKMAESFR